MNTIYMKNIRHIFLRYNKVLNKEKRLQCAAKLFNKTQQTEQ